MSKRLVYLCLVVAVAVLFAQGSAFAWKFGEASDSHCVGDAYNDPVCNLFVSSRGQGLAHMLFAGDHIYADSVSNATAQGYLNQWKAMANSASWVTTYDAIGNHDVGNWTNPRYAMEAICRSSLGMPGNNYSFNSNGAHFVSVDTDRMNSNNTTNFHTVDRAWLEADLAANTQPLTFVFGHESAWPFTAFGQTDSLNVYPADRDAFWNLLVSYGVTAYFAGHEHWYNVNNINNVYQLICGLGQATPNAYTVCDVQSNYLAWQFKQTDGAILQSGAITLPPTTVTATVTSPSSVDLSWTPMSGATDYRIFRNGVQIFATSNTTYTDSGLSPGSYEYRVAAYNASYSGWSTRSQRALVSLGEIIIDNVDAGFSCSANWSTGTGSGKYGADYRWHSTQAISDMATWTPSPALSGNYAVYAWWAAGTNRYTAAPYKITDSSGVVNTVPVDQHINGGQWNYLGTWNLGANSKVQLSCWCTSGYVVVADAIKFVPQ